MNSDAPIDPGQLRIPVLFEQPVESKNAHQETVSAWTTFLQRRIKLEALSGRELFAYEQVNGIVMHKITMRYAAGITSKMRIRYGSRFLNIAAVLDTDARKQWLFLHCMEAV